MKKVLLLSALFFASVLQARTVTLDVASPLNPETITYDENDVWTGTYNEEDYLTIDYTCMSFAHNAWAGYNFWYGFTIAKCQDTTYASMDDQFRCVAGGGLAGKGTPYIMAYAAEGMAATSPCQVYFDKAYTAEEVSLCNGSWAMDNVLKGGGAARAFAAGDSLVVVIQGLDAEYEVIEGKQVTFFLADYRSTNSEEWTLNKAWEQCDLSALGEVYGLIFTMKSSDVGDWGTNTALYFALDGLKISCPTEVATFENAEGGINVAHADTCWQGADDPETGIHIWQSGEFLLASATVESQGYKYYTGFTVTNETANTSTGFTEAYRSASGGAYDGENFAVWNNPYTTDTMIAFLPQVVPGFFINNTAYVVNSMLNGDMFAKAFGNTDYFKLTVHGWLNGEEVSSVDVELASEGEYINQWTYVSLAELGIINAIKFSMSSSDTGDWGMNTPAYFCMDNLGAEMPADYVAPERAKFPIREGIDDINTGVKAMKVITPAGVQIICGDEVYNLMGQRVK